ncbi:hypothetical protein DPMN_166661 [Dreissena polymorpha]|uniref:Uncharacterized protein n=1 Tax=Dreissena polymorpha TaxID=45954 RepID=A0A9D4F1W1_DREPO|nr:hypothetical protein DPMN_166661 [Dreissena polymorpha]
MRCPPICNLSIYDGGNCVYRYKGQSLDCKYAIAGNSTDAMYEVLCVCCRGFPYILAIGGTVYQKHLLNTFRFNTQHSHPVPELFYMYGYTLQDFLMIMLKYNGSVENRKTME